MSSDYGDMCREMREERQKKRGDAFVKNLEMINKSGVEYERHNGYSHLVFYAAEEAIDYWPSSDLWISRKTKKRRHGAQKLIDYIKESK